MAAFFSIHPHVWIEKCADATPCFIPCILLYLKKSSSENSSGLFFIVIEFDPFNTARISGYLPYFLPEFFYFI